MPIFPLEFEPILLRLAPVASSRTLFFVAVHACTQLNVHPGRCGKTEAFGHFDQVELVHIKHGAQTMRGICL